MKLARNVMVVVVVLLSLHTLEMISSATLANWVAILIRWIHVIVFVCANNVAVCICAEYVAVCVSLACSILVLVMCHFQG